MSGGLFALLDDISVLARAAAGPDAYTGGSRRG